MAKHLNRLLAMVMLTAVLCMNICPVSAEAIGYEERIFDISRVHTIDIIIDDWDSFLSTAQSEEYSVCDVIIDGETFSAVGIRGKGNTSLSTVASMDSDRYSFKLEFDHYDSGLSYYGLDKLSLNNLIQDNTMMKDYLTYRMMQEFGVAAPLCSYVWITVNGEPWGLYLAVEAVEDSFLQRNYGSADGELYKPDSTDLGGGRGNGQDFRFENRTDESGTGDQTMPGMDGNGTLPEMPQGFDPFQPGGAPDGQNSIPEGFDPSQMGSAPGGRPAMPGSPDSSQAGNPGGMGGGMDAGGTLLRYTDDLVSSYAAIFDNAKTAVTAADRQRLIASLKTLSQSSDPASVLDTDGVIRYFVVHNYVVNADSYTGSMVHNYYLREQDGRLSMIPWDYNLAFGTFRGGDASAMVCDDIDAPLSVTGTGRPMIDWIFRSEEYTALYHSLFRTFLDTVDPAAIIGQAKDLITPWVEQDPTKFCTDAEFEKGVRTLAAFCQLRSRSIADQLAGGDGMVDTSAITLSDMGTMNQGTPGPGSQAGMQRPDQTDAPEASRTGAPWLLAAAALILAAGLIFAFRFRR